MNNTQYALITFRSQNDGYVDLAYTTDGINWYALFSRGWSYPSEPSVIYNDFLENTNLDLTLSYTPETNCLFFSHMRTIYKYNLTTQTLSNINIPPIYVTSYKGGYQVFYDNNLASYIVGNMYGIFIVEEDFSNYGFLPLNEYHEYLCLTGKHDNGNYAFYKYNYDSRVTLAGMASLSYVSYPVSNISKSSSGGVVTLTMDGDSSKAFHVSNSNKPMNFGMDALIPERLIIKKDMTLNSGVNVNQNLAGIIWGAVAN